MIRRRSNQAHGRWDFRFTHGTGTGRIIFLADSIGREGVDNRYYLEFASDLSYRVSLRKATAGVVATIFTGTKWAIQPHVPYDYRVEHTAGGEFTILIRGNQYQSWTLVPTTMNNPVIDTTHTFCRFVSYWLQPGDKLYLDEARA